MVAVVGAGGEAGAFWAVAVGTSREWESFIDCIEYTHR